MAAKGIAANCTIATEKQPMNATTLMVQGTTSDAGKSMLVTALGRWLSRRGVHVAPFKPQNMALNSAVTQCGGEIGRSQAAQAAACQVPASIDMNPVLLKPNSDIGAQVIIQGHAIGNMDAQDYHDYKKRARAAVLQSHARLQRQYQAIIVEGAGSPAEINLRDNDIANMGFAEAVDCPVILIADIDRGGVFAHIVGTLALLSDSERARIAGFVINRFRGDIALLESGLDWLEQETGKPVLGVLPYLMDLHLEAEDAIQSQQTNTKANALDIVVPVFPRISNHTDFDALRLHPQVNLRFIGVGERLSKADLIILPGSKSVRADLATLREQNWDKDILRHLRYGGKVLGVCGGFQMLGKQIHDPLGIESSAGSSHGLGLLDIESTLAESKTLANVTGHIEADNSVIQGYEIHAGTSSGPCISKPFCTLTSGKSDGAVSQDGQIIGTYLHGLFDHPEACQSLLGWAGLNNAEAPDYDSLREANFERLADMIETHMDTQQLSKLLGIAG